MARYLASQTLLRIEEMIQADQGASFRQHLETVIPHMADAYRGDSFPYRSHMGASGIGVDCARKIWYGFRWSARPSFGGRIIRLFNRGHLEEARFIAMLLMLGVKVYQQTEDGKQFRISDAGGHFGGSGDGVCIGLPDLDPEIACLLEFKTVNEKGFKKYVDDGVESTNYTYYVQMQVYMRKMGIAVALFMTVNKNDDNLYAELIPFDPEVADTYINRGIELVFMETPPEQLNASPGYYECIYCDYKQVCHLKGEPDINCRTCIKSNVMKDGTWTCGNLESDMFKKTLNQEEQLAGCELYRRKF